MTKQGMHLSDEQLVETVATFVRASDAGTSSPAAVSLLRAIASTRDEAQRHELARQAAERAGAISNAALQILRVAIFALA